MTQLFTPPSNKQANIARADEIARQGRITQGTGAINSTFDGQFNDDYFSGRTKAFNDYATPQLEDQYGKAKKALTYSLARDGSLDSSTRAAKEAELQQAYDTARRGVNDQALSYGNQSRTQIEDARSSLISALNSSGDATQAASGAINRAQALSQPTPFNPIGQLFGDFTSTLGTQAAAERATAATGGQIYKSPYDTGLFSSAASVRNSR